MPDEALRTHGNPPFQVAVIHGGPGAAGEMYPVARELASDWGVLEPLQTATTLQGQVEELSSVLEQQGRTPVTLIGFSWGAWLSLIVAAHYPPLVQKLILIGCGSLEERFAEGMREIRLSRLIEEEQDELQALSEVLDDPVAKGRNEAFARFGVLFSKADAFDLIADESQGIEYQVQIYQSVWKEAARVRQSGELLELSQRIRCPVVAIHGNYDPHPAEGVQGPLSSALKDFRMILLENCGHKPWMERQARERLYQVLKAELTKVK